MMVVEWDASDFAARSELTCCARAIPAKQMRRAIDKVLIEF
jgi:hypothetical protein